MVQQKSEPLVSMLTPVYNGEEYLAECIESALKQTYQNWEYVIVNNCSTDRSLEIAEDYAKLDDRIRIHNNTEHLPVMQNLNHAFRQILATSKYCKVIHADDWLFPECVSRMVDLAEEYPSVGIVGSYRLVESTVGPSGLSYPNNHIKGEEICRRYLLNDEYYFGAPSNILLRSDLIRKRDKVYDESYLQADISACLDMLEESDFGFVHQVLSFTRRHKESNTAKIAKKYSTYMVGYLKIHLQYGPIFLSEDEMQKTLSKRIDIFYIEFARNLLTENVIQAYRRHKADLESVDMHLRHGKLLMHILIEMVKLPTKNILKSKGLV